MGAFNGNPTIYRCKCLKLPCSSSYAVTFGSYPGERHCLSLFSHNRSVARASLCAFPCWLRPFSRSNRSNRNLPIKVCGQKLTQIRMKTRVSLCSNTCPQTYPIPLCCGKSCTKPAKACSSHREILCHHYVYEKR